MTTPANGSTPAKRTAAKTTPAKRNGAKSTTGTTPNPGPAAEPLAPTPTIAVALVCVPDELSTSVLGASRQLDKHLKVRGSLYAGFWATKVRCWQRRNLIGFRRRSSRVLRRRAAVDARPAGNAARRRVRRRDPAPAVEHGRARHPRGHPVAGVRTSAPGRPVQVPARQGTGGLRRPASGPGNADAQRRLLRRAARLDPGELEMFQAGQVAYQQYHSLLATCFDAVLTAGDGEQLRPASDAFSDRITYLDNAARYLDSLDGDQRLVAVSL